ncbi:MAG: hypothetical protein AAFZ17_11215 [Cyanobacteria bacterium J06650_10]
MHTEEAIKKLDKQSIGDYQLAKLTHILGALSWLKGDTEVAINFCHQARSLVEQFSDQLRKKTNTDNSDLLHDLEVVKLNTYLTDGICRIGMWQLDQALVSLYKVVELASFLNRDRVSEKKYDRCALFYIAYVHSLPEPSSDPDVAQRVVNELFANWNKNEMPSWLTEYRLYYLGLAFTNLGQFDNALKIHSTVIDDSFHSCYTQANTKHLNGLACCLRGMGRLEEALVNHGKAVTSFQNIGARLDLAEACFQQAITLFECGESKLSNVFIEKATALFKEMNAHYQQQRIIRWVRKIGLKTTILC